MEGHDRDEAPVDSGNGSLLGRRLGALAWEAAGGLDTTGSRRGPEPPAFDQMFRNGVRYRLGSGIEVAVEVQDAGMLKLATGRVTACDPFWGAQVERQVAPFIVRVPPGRYPVTVSLARGLLDGPEPAPLLGAAAKLTIRDEPVVTWEVALRVGQDDTGLQPDQLYSLGVDSGNASLLDASAVGALAALDEPDSELDRRFEQVWGKAWVNLVLDQASELNIVVFHCGLGDGGYPTWIGRNAAGVPACFVVDLLLLSDGPGPITDQT